MNELLGEAGMGDSSHGDAGRGNTERLSDQILFRGKPPIFYAAAVDALLRRAMPAEPYLRIHRWFNYWRYQNAKVSGGRLTLIAATVCWPFRLFYLAVRNKKVRSRRKHVCQATNKSKLSQFLELLYLGIRHSISPRAYYLFRLFEDDRQAIAD